MPGNPYPRAGTIKDLLLHAEKQLCDSDSARLDSEILLCSVTGLDRSRLYACPELDINPAQSAAFLELVTARGDGTPVAYLTGVREFWSLPLQVTGQTLIPRPETECLVEAALARIPAESNLHIADLGTGCGAIALALARERPACHITATDSSGAALAVARTNARQHHVDNISFVTSDWFSTLTGIFDLIVSNPPYVRNDDACLLHGAIRHEPRLALCGGSDGLDAIRLIITTAPEYLNAGGWLCLEHGCDQGPAVRAMFSGSGFTDVMTINDYAGIERACCGRYIPVRRHRQD